MLFILGFVDVVTWLFDWDLKDTPVSHEWLFTVVLAIPSSLEIA